MDFPAGRRCGEGTGFPWERRDAWVGEREGVCVCVCRGGRLEGVLPEPLVAQIQEHVLDRVNGT